MVRIPTRETPFKTTFGLKAVIPIEIGLTSLRVKNYKEKMNKEELRINLDLIDKAREKAKLRSTRYHRAMTIYYGKKVKIRRFDLRDLVLKKFCQETRDPS